MYTLICLAMCAAAWQCRLVSNKEGQEGAVGEVKGKVLVAGKPADRVLICLIPKQPYVDEKKRPPMNWHINQGVFRPEHVAILAGQEILIDWSKDEAHELAAFALSNGLQARDLRASISPLTLKFERQEDLIVVDCAINSKTRGYVTVVPSKWYAWSNERGEFVLPGLVPPGTYSLRSIHPTIGIREQPIRVDGTDVAPAQLIEYPAGKKDRTKKGNAACSVENLESIAAVRSLNRYEQTIKTSHASGPASSCARRGTPAAVRTSKPRKAKKGKKGDAARVTIPIVNLDLK
jgi:hypothetical protein